MSGVTDTTKLPALLRARSAQLLTPALLIMGLVVLVVLSSMGGSPVWQRVIAGLLVSVIIAVGWHIFTGNSGVLSFGHMGFVAIGAYVTALLTVSTGAKSALLPHLPELIAKTTLAPVPAILIGGLFGAAIGAIAGIPVMRMARFPAMIGTFAVLMIVNQVVRNWTSLTGSGGTIVGIPPWTTIWTALPWAIGAILVAFVYQITHSGLRMRAAREDEDVARASGIGVVRERQIALILSAFVVACGGGLLAMLLGTVSPSRFYLAATFLILAMLVVGGMGSLSGAVIGAVGISLLLEGLRLLEAGVTVGFVTIPERPGLQELGIAIVMLVVIIARPRGLTKGEELDRLLVRRLRR